MVRKLPGGVAGKSGGPVSKRKAGIGDRGSGIRNVDVFPPDPRSPIPDPSLLAELLDLHPAGLERLALLAGMSGRLGPRLAHYEPVPTPTWMVRELLKQLALELGAGDVLIRAYATPAAPESQPRAANREVCRST